LRTTLAPMPSTPMFLASLPELIYRRVITCGVKFRLQRFSRACFAPYSAACATFMRLAASSTDLTML